MKSRAKLKSSNVMHLLLFESPSRETIERILRLASRGLGPDVNVFDYRIDDDILRVILASLREGSTSARKKME